MRKQQRGLSLIGLILASVVVIGIAVVAMKVAPSVIEYYTILKNIKVVANNNALASVAEVRAAYDRQASIDATPSLTGADLEISKEGGQLVISFAYSKKIPLVGNVSLLIDYAGSSSGSGRPLE